MDIECLIQKLKCSESALEIRAVGVVLAEALGCHYFLYAGIGQVPISSPEVTIVGNYPEQWMSRYQEKEYAKIDPTVWHAAHAVTPLFWCDAEVTNDAVCEFFQEAKQHGIVSGVTIPLHSGEGYSAIMTIVSADENEEVYQTLKAEIHKIFLFAYSLHSIVMQRLEITGKHEQREPLSENEKNCLMWAADGKTSWEIGQILSMKERTVVFHLNNAAKKLGAVNRQHAIASAIALGEVRANIATIPDRYKFT